MLSLLRSRAQVREPASASRVESHNCRSVDVGVPIRDPRARNLLTLQPGVVVASDWVHTDDLPVLSGHQPLARSEFEVVDCFSSIASAGSPPPRCAPC